MYNSAVRTQPLKTYDHAPQTENLPLAFGANFHDDPINRNTLRKSHTLQLPPKTDFVPPTEYSFTGVLADGTRNSAKSAGAGDDDDAAFTGWFSEELSEDDQENFVVRMLAYFSEKVPESRLEMERIRKVCIHYYVVDNSISIAEKMQRNSGLGEGEILSRRCVPKDPRDVHELLELSDFRIGDSVTIYSQEYHIVDIDRRSRRYFREIFGVELPEALPIPEDNFTRSVAASGTPAAKRLITSDDMDRKRVIEQQLTGIYSKRSSEDLAIAKEFLKYNINAHLTYLALWDDRRSICGDLHYCVIRLFLENSSIEIAEAKPDNCGRWGGPTLVSRQRIQKPAATLEQSRYQEHTYGKLMKNNFLSAEDIRLGEKYPIYGKVFYVYDCDDFTRTHMKEKLGVAVGPAIDIKPIVDGGPKPVPFGLQPSGKHEDRNARRPLNMSPAAKAAVEEEEEDEVIDDGRVMKFAAKLAKPIVRGDEEREFVISFFLQKAELQIYEKPKRNSGMLGGRFLARGAHGKRMPDGSTVPFSQTDFQLGEEVIIYERPFILTAHDERTQRILDGTDMKITEERIKYLMVLLKKQLDLKFTQPNEAFLALTPQGTFGYLQIKSFLRSCSCNVTDEEALLLLQNVFPGTSGAVSYEDYCRALGTSSDTMGEAALSTRSIRSVDMTKSDHLKAGATVSQEQQRRKVLHDMLQSKLIQRKGTVQEQFRLMGDRSANSRLNREVFRRSLNSVLQFNMSKKDEDILVSLLFDGSEDENGDITYTQYQDFVDDTDMK